MTPFATTSFWLQFLLADVCVDLEMQGWGQTLTFSHSCFRILSPCNQLIILLIVSNSLITGIQNQLCCDASDILITATTTVITNLQATGTVPQYCECVKIDNEIVRLLSGCERMSLVIGTVPLIRLAYVC